MDNYYRKLQRRLIFLEKHKRYFKNNESVDFIDNLIQEKEYIKQIISLISHKYWLQKRPKKKQKTIEILLLENDKNIEKAKRILQEFLKTIKTTTKKIK